MFRALAIATRGDSRTKTFYETRARFSVMEQAAVAYVYEEQFHDQLKARLLDAMVLTQSVKESTRSNIRKPGDADFASREAARQSEDCMESLHTIFHKVGGQVADIREGVCYVFFQDEATGTSNNACCAAQMFLDLGHGVNEQFKLGHYHLFDRSPGNRPYMLAT